MERVEVTVGPDGAEFLGVRRKHCLKGTRFSLPKPKVTAGQPNIRWFPPLLDPCPAPKGPNALLMSPLPLNSPLLPSHRAGVVPRATPS